MRADGQSRLYTYKNPLADEKLTRWSRVQWSRCSLPGTMIASGGFVSSPFSRLMSH
jgi:hypothetical protein